MLIRPIFVTQKHSQRLLLKRIWQEIFDKVTYAPQNKSCLKILYVYRVCTHIHMRMRHNTKVKHNLVLL